jgi:RNA-directed DNA polymerase
MSLQKVSTRLAQIAKMGREHREVTGLAHHIDVEMLRAAYEKTRKDGATGIDGVNAQEYAKELEKNLSNLHERLRGQKYRAPAVRRAYIPKEDGGKRPLGIPTYEDKLVQRATLMVLEQVYEQEFYECSYGFRPGKSAHQALTAIKRETREKNINCIIDADIQGFFDSVDHEILQGFIARRIKDFSIRRLVGKWLNAGVWEQGITTPSESGTPQGGVISPLMANIYLHYVLDEWYAKEVKPRLKGMSFLVRYADDFVIGCEHEEDAQRVLEVLKLRLEKYKLRLSETKTRLVKFQKPKRETTPRDNDNGTFTFLGFSHQWWKSSRTENWYIRRKVAGKRVTRGLRNVRRWLKTNRHRAIHEQARRLHKHLQGVYQYYGLGETVSQLYSYRREAERAWHYWLNRRGSKKRLTWKKFTATIQRVWKLPFPHRRQEQLTLQLRTATCHA